MGNKHCPNVGNSSIYVKMDGVEFNPGDKIFGDIYLILEKDVEEAILDFKFEGKEIVDFYPNMKKQYAGSDKIHRTKHLANQVTKIPLPTPKFISAGQYKFPFSITLPVEIPGSFYSEEGQIVYTVGGELFSGSSILLEHSVEISVRERVEDIQFSVTKEVHKNLKTWLFSSKGHADIKVHIERNCLCPGETLPIHVEADCRNTSLSLKKIKVILYKETEYRDTTGNNASEVRYIFYEKFPGVKVGTTNTLEVSIPIPSNVYPTTKGELINCCYYLKVKGKAAGFRIGSHSPKLKIPIFVFCLPVEQSVMNAPENWNPYSMPKASIYIKHPTEDELAIIEEESKKQKKK